MKIKRNSSSLLFAFFIALTSFVALTFAKPPARQSDLFKLDQPKQGQVYFIGQQVHVHAVTKDGQKGLAWKKNPDVKLVIQYNVIRPTLNKVVVDKIKYRDLATRGASFKAKAGYYDGKDFPNTPYRVRAVFHIDDKNSGFVDTKGFHLKPKKT